MKMFIKTVCITLCISVTALFFSSYKRVEAVAVTTVSAAVVAIGSIIVAVATYFAIDNIPDIQSYVKSSSFESSITTDEEGIAIFNPSSGLPAIVNPNIFNALSEESVKAHNQHLYLYTHTSSSGGDHGGGGKHRIPPSAYEAAVTAAIAGIIASEVLSDSSSEDNLGSIPSGAAAGIITGITNANGKPQKVISAYSPEVIEAFENFGITYTMTPSITDVHLYHRSGGLSSNVSSNFDYGFFIISDGKLYLLGIPSQYSYSTVLFSWYSNSSSFQIDFSLVGNIAKPYLPSDYVQEAKIVEVDGRLCFSLYQYYITQDKIYAYENQIIYGNPKPTLYPLLFERPTFSVSSNCSSSIQNFQLYNELKFVNRLDCNDFLYEVDVLSGNYECCGFIENFSNSTNNIYSAALSIGQYSTSITGGEKTVYSELSDIEKAIYALAQQQGITYEQMLESCNILINENGEMYLESLDGVTKSIDSLLAEFEKLLEQGDISNEQGAAMIEQLTALLTYLKSLNIEGISSYIASIEIILDGLNQHDEDQSALLGDVVEQLQGLNEYLVSIDLSDSVKNISQIKSSTEAIAEAMTSILNHEKDVEEKEQKAVLAIASLLSPTVGNYRLYEQCKYLLEKLFNYDDINIPPDFAFFWDSDGDGIAERYDPFNLSFLETTLTNETFADKTWFFNEIKIIDFIRYLIALVIYSLFVMRLIKRLPTFYGLGPLSRFGG